MCQKGNWVVYLTDLLIGEPERTEVRFLWLTSLDDDRFDTTSQFIWRVTDFLELHTLLDQKKSLLSSIRHILHFR